MDGERILDRPGGRDTEVIRRQALAKLGLGISVAYVAPVLLTLMGCADLAFLPDAGAPAVLGPPSGGGGGEGGAGGGGAGGGSGGG